MPVPSITVLWEVVVVRKDLPMDLPDIAKRRDDVSQRCRRTASECPREGLDSHLSDAVALQHRLDGELGADERAVRLELDIVDDGLSHHSEPGRHIPEP